MQPIMTHLENYIEYICDCHLVCEAWFICIPSVLKSNCSVTLIFDLQGQGDILFPRTLIMWGYMCKSTQDNQQLVRYHNLSTFDLCDLKYDVNDIIILFIVICDVTCQNKAFDAKMR